MGIVLGLTLLVTILLGGYALLRGNRYAITFDSRNGEEETTQFVLAGHTVEEIPKPTREGYLFNGWTKDGEEYDFSSKVYSSFTLEASWKKVGSKEELTYEVTFDSDGGSMVESQILGFGETVMEPTKPVKEGYTFQGWYVKDTRYDFSKKVYSSFTLKAKWKKK